MTVDRTEAVLVTGVYGAGKSTVVEDLATLLEEAGVHYGAIDLDWLSWYDAGIPDDDGWDVLLANLTAVVGNYRSAGVTRFAMAGFLENASDVERLGDALAMPVRTVRLVVPLAVVERRLTAVGTAERLANLDVARRQVAEDPRHRVRRPHRGRRPSGPPGRWRDPRLARLGRRPGRRTPMWPSGGP